MKRVTARRVEAVVVGLCLLAIVSVGCTGDPAADAVVKLDFWQFDQSPNAGWRLYAARGEYGRAADLIDHYLEHRADLIEAHRGYLHLHAGELRAYQGDDRRALEHLALAVVNPDSMPDRFPRSFNALAAGTYAFIDGDMAGVRVAVEAIRSLPALTARDSMFLKSLEELVTKEGMTFREAEPPPE